MPEGLDAVIERAVAKDPAERYPSAGALIAAAREREGAALAATAGALGAGASAPTRARSRERRLRGRRAAGGAARRGAAQLAWVGAGLAAIVGAGRVLVARCSAATASTVSDADRGRQPPLRVAAGAGRDLGDQRTPTAP